MLKAKPFFNRITSLTFVVILIISATPNAQALSGFLEPYVGIGQAQIAIYSLTGNDYDTKDIAFGFDLGFKGGLSLGKKFFTGLDYQTAGPFRFGKTASQAEWTTQMIGAGIGVDYDVVRFWLGYYPSQSIHDAKNSVDYKGTAYKVGVGFKIGKSVCTNLEISFLNFSSVTDGGAMSGTGSPTRAATIPTTEHPPQVQTAFTSISIPVDL